MTLRGVGVSVLRVLGPLGKPHFCLFASRYVSNFFGPPRAVGVSTLWSLRGVNTLFPPIIMISFSFEVNLVYIIETLAFFRAYYRLV